MYNNDLYVALKNILINRFNITPYFVLLDNIPNVDDEEYFYFLSDKVKELLKISEKDWLSYDDIDIFYLGRNIVYNHFFEILVHSIGEKKLYPHFISKKNKRAKQISFALKFSLDI